MRVPSDAIRCHQMQPVNRSHHNLRSARKQSSSTQKPIGSQHEAITAAIVSGDQLAAISTCVASILIILASARLCERSSFFELLAAMRTFREASMSRCTLAMNCSRFSLRSVDQLVFDSSVACHIWKAIGAH